jgi:2-polyprenyl-6-methoxyphenol hydroxylase-like FAD-dependent oxidoreductase
MTRILMIGGGMVGTVGALLLQHDGHDVTVVERDATPPPAPGASWGGWSRHGVRQFRLPHAILARFTHVLRAELPALAQDYVESGALTWNQVRAVPVPWSEGYRSGDDRFDAITGRRPFMEAVARRHAEVAGVTFRHGTRVTGLRHELGHDGVPHVSGIVTEDGGQLEADLVVDAGGRHSPVPGWLRELGPGPVEEMDDSGFVYYGRHFRSADGALPPLRGHVVVPLGSISTATLPAEDGTWSVVIYAASGDRPLRRLQAPEVWTAVIRACPLVAHWIDAEPITGVDVMAKVEDRYLRYERRGVPVVTGLLPLGDAWACTSPSLGRGCSIGALHAVALRDAIRQASLDDHRTLSKVWQALTDERVEPFVRDTIAVDRHRLAEMQAAARFEAYLTEDPGWRMGQALARSAAHDPSLLRQFVEVTQLLSRGVEVLGRRGTAERALALGGDPTSQPGPDRTQLLELVGA